MAELITGHFGEAHISSEDWGRFQAAVIGDGRYVAQFGDGLAATVDSANSITIGTGLALFDGRTVEVPTAEDLSIDSGSQGTNRYDIIGFAYSKAAATGIESVELAVIKGTPTAGTPSDPELEQGDILDGAVAAFMPLWRIPISGITVGTPVQLFETLGNKLSDMALNLASLTVDGAIQAGGNIRAGGNLNAPSGSVNSLMSSTIGGGQTAKSTNVTQGATAPVFANGNAPMNLQDSAGKNVGRWYLQQESSGSLWTILEKQDTDSSVRWNNISLGHDASHNPLVAVGYPAGWRDAINSHFQHLANNVVNSTSSDTPARWTALGDGTSFYNTDGCLQGQPNRYGLLINFTTTKSGTHNVLQLFAHGTGGVWIRCANAADTWAMPWRRIDNGWTSLGSVTGTTSMALNLAGYGEVMIAAKFTSTSKKLWTTVLPTEALESSALEVWLGGGATGGSSSVAGTGRAVCNISTTSFVGKEVKVGNSDVTSSTTWTIYAR